MPPPKPGGRPRIVDKLKKGKGVAVSSKQKLGKRSKSADAIVLSPVTSFSLPSQGVRSGDKSEQDKTENLILNKKRVIIPSRKYEFPMSVPVGRMLVKRALGSKSALQMSLNKRPVFKKPPHLGRGTKLASKYTSKKMLSVKPKTSKSSRIIQKKSVNTSSAETGSSKLRAEWQPVVSLKKLEQYEISKYLAGKKNEENLTGYDLFQTVGLMRVNKEVKQQVPPGKNRRRSRLSTEEMNNLSAALKMANDAILSMNISETASDTSETIKYFPPLRPAKPSPKVGKLSSKILSSRKKTKLSLAENHEVIEIDKERSSSPLDYNKLNTISPKASKVTAAEGVSESDCVSLDTSEQCAYEDETFVLGPPCRKKSAKRKSDCNVRTTTKKGKIQLPLSTEQEETLLEYSGVNIPENSSQESERDRSYTTKRSVNGLQPIVPGAPHIDDDDDDDDGGGDHDDSIPSNVKANYCVDTSWNAVSMIKLNKKVQELEKAVDSLQTNVSNLTYTVKNKQGQIRALERRLKYYESSKLHAILREVIAEAEKCNSAHKEEYTAGFLINLLFAYDQMVLQRRRSVAGE